MNNLRRQQPEILQKGLFMKCLWKLLSMSNFFWCLYCSDFNPRQKHCPGHWRVSHEAAVWPNDMPNAVTKILKFVFFLCIRIFFLFKTSKKTMFFWYCIIALDLGFIYIEGISTQVLFPDLVRSVLYIDTFCNGYSVVTNVFTFISETLEERNSSFFQDHSFLLR